MKTRNILTYTFLLFISTMTILIQAQYSSCETLGEVDDERRNLYWDWYSDPDLEVDLFWQGGQELNVSMPWNESAADLFPIFALGELRDDLDIFPKDGWVLFRRDFGEDNSIRYPYLMLYNKYRGILRFLYYGVNDSEASYAVATMTITDGYSPIFELAHLENKGFIADETQYDKVTEIHVVGEYIRDAWNYFDFNVSGYDPEIATKIVKASISIELYQEFNIKLEGTSEVIGLANSELDVRNGTSSSQISFTNKIINGGLTIYKDGAKKWKSLEDARKKYHDMIFWTLGQDEWWADPLAELAFEAYNANWIPALGPFAAIISFFSGGGSSNTKLPLASGLLPRKIQLEGTAETSWPFSLSNTFYLPGCIITDKVFAAQNNSLPLYDKPFGIYNLISQPTIDVYQWIEYQPLYSYKWNIVLKEPFFYIPNPFIFSISSFEAGYVFSDREVNDNYTDINNFYSTTYEEIVCPPFPWTPVSIATKVILNPIGAHPDIEPVKIIKSYIPHVENFYVYEEVPNVEIPTLSGNIINNTTINSRKINDHLIIKNGATLTIEEGSILFISPTKKITVEEGGKIMANGSREMPIKFIRENSDVSWDKIELFGNNNTFTYCVFDGGTWNVHVVGSTGNLFQNCTFKNGTRGFYASGYLNKFILDECLIINNSDIGVYAKQCWCSIRNSTICDNGGQGVRILAGRLGYSDPGYFKNNYIYSNGSYGIGVKGGLYLGYGSTPGNNLIFNNNNAEIKIENYFGSHLYQSNDGGLSDIFDDALGYYIYNTKPSTIYVENNFWGNEDGPEGGNSRFYGTVNWNPYEIEPQTYAEIIGAYDVLQKKSNKSSLKNEITIIPRSTSSDKNKVTTNENYLLKLKNKIEKLLNQIYIDEYNSKTAHRILELYLLLGEDPEDKLGYKKQILALISEKSYKGMDINDNSSNYKNHSQKEKNAIRLNGEISMLAEIDILIQNQQLKSALNAINDIRPYIKDKNHRRELLDFEVTILEGMREYKEAHKCLRKLIKYVEKNKIYDYSYSESYELWEEDLLYEMGGNPYLGKYTSENNDNNYKNNIVPTAFTLEQNYPNPFNPITTIPFNLHLNAKVKLVVYNIQGREIETLTNRSYLAGRHTLQFEARNLPSGIYFIRAEINALESPYNIQTLTKKIMLMK